MIRDAAKDERCWKVAKEVVAECGERVRGCTALLRHLVQHHAHSRGKNNRAEEKDQPQTRVDVAALIREGHRHARDHRQQANTQTHEVSGARVVAANAVKQHNTERNTDQGSGQTRHDVESEHLLLWQTDDNSEVGRDPEL